MKGKAVCTSFIRLIAAIFACSILVAGNLAFAQTGDTTETAAPIDAATLLDELPEPLTAEAVREMVSRLSDSDVRALLLHRLDADVEAENDGPSEVESLMVSIERNAAVFWRNIGQLLPQTLTIPSGFAIAFDRMAEGQGFGRILTIFALIAGVMVAAFAAEWVLTLFLAKLHRTVAESKATGIWSTLSTLTLRLGLYLVGLLIFLAVGANIFFALFENGSSARSFAMTILWSVVSVRLTYYLIAYVLAPRRPDLRLVAADDATAAYMTRQSMLIVGMYTLGFGLLQWMWASGVPPMAGRFGFWVNLAVHATVMWTIWRARDGITTILLGKDEQATPGEQRFARLWPRIAVGLVFLEWVIVEIIAESGHVALLSLSTIFTTLAIIALLPLLDLMLREIGKRFDPILESDNEAVAIAKRATQQGMTRCGRVVAACILVVVLAGLWGLDITQLAEFGLGAKIAAAILEIILIILIAYGLWEAVNITVSRRLALEAAEAGGEDAGAGDEGGQGGSRLGTLLPLLRGFALAAIATMAVLAILGELGVNIAPLLAGAGIIGLAIGFGAQTLVKDIVSGVFFLVDDAFRIGEYIDVGDVMGTVEKISIRSLRLRHHLGALHTVPYGDIAKLTNFSRDWVIVKLKFRVPFDTDIGKVKKIFKQIGKDLWADPDLGPDFLDPFKSQGVLDVDDSAIIVRGKFTAKPGKQFLIKREIYVRVQAAFEEAGIPFARKQVLVHIPGEEGRGDERPSREAIAAAADAADNTPDYGEDESPLGAPA
ncbi:MAG: mechanosensitive ion channel domain-containing protein [Pseudomonadota bacterium]